MPKSRCLKFASSMYVTSEEPSHSLNEKNVAKSLSLSVSFKIVTKEPITNSLAHEILKLSNVFHEYTFNYSLEFRRRVINFPSPLIHSKRRIGILLALRGELFSRLIFQDGEQGSNGTATVRNRDRVRGSSAHSRRRWKDGSAIQQKFQRAARRRGVRRQTRPRKVGGREGTQGIFKGHFRETREITYNVSFFRSTLSLHSREILNELYTCRIH